MSAKKEKRRSSLHDIYDHTIGFTDKERRRTLYTVYVFLFFYMTLLVLGVLMFYYIVHSDDLYGTKFADTTTVLEVVIAIGLFVLLQFFKITFLVY